MTQLSPEALRAKFPNGTIITITPRGKELIARRTDNAEDVTGLIRRHVRYKAHENGKSLEVRHTKPTRKFPNGTIQYRQIDSVNGSTVAAPVAAPVDVDVSSITDASTAWSPKSDDEISAFVAQAMSHKPSNLIISEINWKYLMRSALRGKNIMMVGPSGCGKTEAAFAVHETFPNREFFNFNLGASQDPRGMLIGNTHYDNENGTFFGEALFVKAIQTPGAVILLDELSREHDDASNILMTVLDDNQRYLRIDEMPETPTIAVAEGVVFLATANVGNEYTGTRVMDRALLDRFVIIEMAALNKGDEITRLTNQFPTVHHKLVNAVAEIACHTRNEVKADEPAVSTIISTRATIEIVGLIQDGFTLAEAAEVCIFPFFSDQGGAESERTYMQQLVQKHLPTDLDDKNRPWDDAPDDDDDTSEMKTPW